MIRLISHIFESSHIQSIFRPEASLIFPFRFPNVFLFFFQKYYSMFFFIWKLGKKRLSIFLYCFFHKKTDKIRNPPETIIEALSRIRLSSRQNPLFRMKLSPGLVKQRSF